MTNRVRTVLSKIKSYPVLERLEGYEPDWGTPDFLDLIPNNPKMIGYIERTEADSNRASPREVYLDLDGDWSKGYRRQTSKFSGVLQKFIRFQSDEELQKVILEYTAACCGETELTGFDFKIVKGDDIAVYYDVENYSEEELTKDDYGLWGSCMRDVDSEFFNIYTKNPNQIALAVILDEEGLVKARCLLWYLKDGTKLYDRIYSDSHGSEMILAGRLEKEGYILCSNCNTKKLTEPKPYFIELDHIIFDYYPYIDTFAYYKRGTNILANYEYSDNDRASTYYEMRNTDGSFDGEHVDGEVCPYCDCEVDEIINVYNPSDPDVTEGCHECAVYSLIYHNYIFSDNATEIRYTDGLFWNFTYVLTEDAVFCSVTGEQYFKGHCVLDVDDKWIHQNYAVMPLGSTDFYYIEDSRITRENNLYILKEHGILNEV